MNNADDDDEVVAIGNEKKTVPVKTHDELLIEVRGMSYNRPLLFFFLLNGRCGLMV